MIIDLFIDIINQIVGLILVGCEAAYWLNSTGFGAKLPGFKFWSLYVLDM